MSERGQRKDRISTDVRRGNDAELGDKCCGDRADGTHSGARTRELSNEQRTSGVRDHRLDRRERRDGPGGRHVQRKRQHDHRGRNGAGGVQMRRPYVERSRGGRQCHDQEGTEQRPRRQCPANVLGHVKQEQVTDQTEIDALAEAGLPAFLWCRRRSLAGGPRVPREHDHRQTDNHEQRRQNADGCAGVPPPHRQDDPRQQSAGHRQNRRPSSGALDEQTGIQNGQEHREAPERATGARAGREKQQHGEARKEHRAGAPLRLHDAPEAPPGQRYAEIEQGEGRVQRHRGPQARRTEMRRRPGRFSRKREERCREVQPGIPGREGPPHHDRENHECRREDRPRRLGLRLDANDHRDRKQQDWRDVPGVAPKVRQWPTQAIGNERGGGKHRGEGDGKCRDGLPGRGRIGSREPHAEDQQRREAAHRVERPVAPRDGDRRDAQHDDQQEPEEQAGTGTVLRDCGQEHRKQQRHGGRGKP